MEILVGLAGLFGVVAMMAAMIAIGSIWRGFVLSLMRIPTCWVA